GDRLATRTHDPLRQLSGIAGPPPLPGPGGAPIRPARPVGISVRERCRGPGAALRRDGCSRTARCLDGGRAEAGCPAAAGFCLATPVAPIRRLGSLDQGYIRQVGRLKALIEDAA